MQQRGHPQLPGYYWIYSYMDSSVIFHDLKPRYALGDNIIVVFECGDFDLSSTDWIGLFAADWISLDNFIDFKTIVPFGYVKESRRLYRTIFQTRNFSHNPNIRNSNRFQFVYVSSVFDCVLGVSTHFCLDIPTPPPSFLISSQGTTSVIPMSSIEQIDITGTGLGLSPLKKTLTDSTVLLENTKQSTSVILRQQSVKQGTFKAVKRFVTDKFNKHKSEPEFTNSHYLESVQFSSNMAESHIYGNRRLITENEFLKSQNERLKNQLHDATTTLQDLYYTLNKSGVAYVTLPDGRLLDLSLYRGRLIEMEKNEVSTITMNTKPSQSLKQKSELAHSHSNYSNNVYKNQQRLVMKNILAKFKEDRPFVEEYIDWLQQESATSTSISRETSQSTPCLVSSSINAAGRNLPSNKESSNLCDESWSQSSSEYETDDRPLGDIKPNQWYSVSSITSEDRQPNPSSQSQSRKTSSIGQQIQTEVRRKFGVIHGALSRENMVQVKKRAKHKSSVKMNPFLSSRNYQDSPTSSPRSQGRVRTNLL